MLDSALSITTNVTSRQLDRLESLEKRTPTARIVGYKRFDKWLISPLIRLPKGSLCELHPNGRLSPIERPA